MAISETRIELLKSQFARIIRDRNGYKEMYNSLAFKNKDGLKVDVDRENAKLMTLETAMGILGIDTRNWS